MITESDNDAGREVYRARRRPRPERRRPRRRGCATSCRVGALFEARITAADQARLFLRIDRLVPARHRAYARALLAGIVGPQRWGIAPVAPRAPLRRLLQGAAGARGSSHQAALLERDGRRVALAVLTSGEPTVAYGQATLAGVADAGAGPMTRIAVIHHLAQPFLGHAADPLGAVEEHFGTLPELDGLDGLVSLGGEQAAWDPALERRGGAAARGGRARDPGARRLPRRPAALARARRGEPAAAAPARDLGADRGARPRRPGARARSRPARTRCTGTRTASSRRRAPSRCCNGHEAAARRASASAASRGASSSIRRSTPAALDGWYAELGRGPCARRCDRGGRPRRGRPPPPRSGGALGGDLRRLRALGADAAGRTLGPRLIAHPRDLDADRAEHDER